MRFKDEKMMFNLDTLKTAPFPANPDWLNKVRTQQLQAFLDRGFPTRQEESWKYIDCASLTKTAFNLLPQSTHSNPPKIESPSTDPTFIFLNGCFQPEASHLTGLPKEAILLPVSKALKTYTGLIQPFFETNNPTTHPFATLNTAFFSDGVFLYLPPHVHLKKPIHCIHLNQAEGMWHTRNILILREGAQANFIEHFQGNSDALYFENTVTQAELGLASHLNYYKIQQESLKAHHIANIQITQKANSQLNTFHATLGGKLSRDDIHIQLEGKEAACRLKGFYMPQKHQCMDHHITAEHLAEHTYSQQHYKGILKDQSRGIFNGKVVVHSNAHKTVAHQTNQNILLSATAEIDTKPELEIYNDDVKCSHGATVGPLSQEAIFYLQSRGMNKAQATQLLIEAFFNELILSIPFPEVAQKLNALTTHEA